MIHHDHIIISSSLTHEFVFSTDFDGPNRYTKLQNVIFDLSMEIADRINEEFLWNGREARALKLTYQFNTRDGRNKEVHFRLDEYRFRDSAQQIHQTTWRRCGIENAELPRHIRLITSVKFTITQFVAIDDVIERIRRHLRLQRTPRWHMKRTRGSHPPSAYELDELFSGYELPY